MKHLDKLGVFFAVAELGSYTRAAEALDISKSTVSRTVSELEDIVGLKLLNRSSRQLALTEEGRQLYERCQSIANEYEGALKELSDKSQRVSGNLRVCLPTFFGQLLVAPKLPAFLAQYKELKVRVDLRHTTISGIDSRTDLAVIFGELNDSSMIARRIADIPQVICATPQYLDQHPGIVVPEDLRAHNSIVLSLPNIPRAQHWSLQDASSRKIYSVEVNECFATNDTYMAKQVMVNHGGVCVLPTYAVKDELEQGVLNAVLDQYTLPRTPVYAVYHSRIQNSPRITVFLDFLEQLLKTQ